MKKKWNFRFYFAHLQKFELFILKNRIRESLFQPIKEASTSRQKLSNIFEGFMAPEL